MIHYTKVLPLYPLEGSYDKEEESLKKIRKVFFLDDIPKDSNIIYSHVIYKVKTDDDRSLKRKI